MSSRSDAYYAARYEADQKWYNNFVSNGGFAWVRPTQKQIATIKEIENRSPRYPKFTGYSSKEASVYISAYGRD